ncbi:MAG: teichoic acid ABC transporter permease, partial [Bacillaceae bacterium]|nr:teichoic acid ABC transporter permease [Bacillaceae bacterium]
LSQLVNFGFGLLVLLAFVVGVWDMPGLSVLWIPFIVLIQLLVIMALALPLAYVSVFVRDMDNLIGHLLRIWFYASPIVWVRSAIPQGWSWILDLNPMAYLLSSFSDVLLYDKSPNVSKLLVIGAGALVVIFWSTYYYSRNEHRIVKVL